MKPGTLIHSEPVETSINGAKAWRVSYASKDVNDALHEVTGIVVAPEAPADDRVVVTWSHGTTGLGDAACPSAQPDPARELTVYFSPEATAQIDYGVPGLQRFIDRGRIVVATDYQGLGSPGVHQYQVNRSNGRDSLFIAHAARSLDIGAGDRLISVGWSQGGGAAAALAELDDDDFGSFSLKGTVLLSPGVTVIALKDPVGIGAALSDPGTPPDSHLLMMLMGHTAAFPGLELPDLFTPLGVEMMNAAWNSQPVHHLNDTAARLFRLKGPILHGEPTKLGGWKKALAEGSAGTGQPRGPILMCVDSFDGGTVIPVAWQKSYAETVTALGAQVETVEFPEDDHFSVTTSSVDRVHAWIERQLG